MISDFLSLPFRWSRHTYGDRVFLFDAFVSHAGGDRSERLVEDLRSRGVTIWHDGSQEMGDAQFRMRLTNALLRSRYVILVVDHEPNILGREWVAAEWRSAVEAESLSALSRLIIAKWQADLPLPRELTDHPQYIVPDDLEELANVVKTGNLLPACMPVEDEPPPISTLLASFPRPGPDEPESPNQLLYWLTLRALIETREDPTSPSHALYSMWVFSHHPPELLKLDTETLDPVVACLETLASTGHTEGRANSCFMLVALAEHGCPSAGKALLRVLRREEDPSIVDLLAGWFLDGRDGLPPLAPEDYGHILLISTSLQGDRAETVISHAPPETAVFRLRHSVYRTTWTHFEKLRADHKAGEARIRLGLLLDSEPGTLDWEGYFNGLAMDAGYVCPVVGPNSPVNTEGYAVFIEATERFSDEYIRRADPNLWRVAYENVIFGPLITAHVLGHFANRPMEVFRKFLDALEAPVAQDLKRLKDLLREAPGSGTREHDLLREELELRLRVVDCYRKGPHPKDSEGGIIHIDHLDTRCRIDLMERDEDLTRRLAFHFSFGGPRPPHPALSPIWKRWAGIPRI